MADLEQLALKRDRGFLVRLVLLLALGLVVGAFLYGRIIGDSTTGCLARTIGGGSVGERVVPSKGGTDKPSD